MTDFDDCRAEALFASNLQPSECPDRSTVRAAVFSLGFMLGEAEIAARVAQEFGEHPENAERRMAWARQIAAEAFALSEVAR